MSISCIRYLYSSLKGIGCINSGREIMLLSFLLVAEAKTDNESSSEDGSSENTNDIEEPQDNEKPIVDDGSQEEKNDRKEITTESNEHPVSYDRQMHQAYRKGVRYVVEGDQLKLKSKDGSISMSNLEVRNKGKQITGDYSFKSDDDSGKVTMTKLNN